MSNLNSHAFPVKSERGNAIGEVLAGVFRKDRVFGSKHMMQKPLGWALDVVSLSQAEGYGADLVQLTDIETGLVYRATIHLIKERGVPINRGYGRQICLPLEFWQVNSPVSQLSSQAATTFGNVQLALFESS